ncbi:MAG TPA: SAM-dependent methyltransferase, partial [Chloroflexi bacterium]|nr:SAM-dependent methyltransferase [Chloroflexota bacterium]
MRELTDALVTFLLSPQAGAALDALTARPLPKSETLAVLTTLRREFSPAEAAALLDQARLRQRARTKFSRADSMFFTDEALQQASGETIASYRAQRYARFARVADLGCGIGGDTINLARAGPLMAALDLDPIRLRLARANAAAYGVAEQVLFVQTDWTIASIEIDAAFADPSRRIEGRRLFSLHVMQPPLAALLAVQARLPALGVKVAPGVADEEVPRDSEVEFISERGTLKEAVLWFGRLRTRASRRATLLPAGASLTSEDPVE